MAEFAMPPGRFRYPTRLLPQWGYSISMADTKTAAQGGIIRTANSF